MPRSGARRHRQSGARRLSALNSPLRHWASDEDGARPEAQRRLDASLASMRAAGIDARGEVGDGDPVQAIEDAVRTFRPDELIVATYRAGPLALARAGVVEKARSASTCR